MLATATVACRTPSTDPARDAPKAVAPLWSAETGAGPDPASGPAVAADGMVFAVGTLDVETLEVGWPRKNRSRYQPSLLAFDAAGRLRTKLPGSPPADRTTSEFRMWVTLAPWGTAYAVDHTGGVYAMFPTGETSFRQAKLSSSISGPPALGPGGRLYVSGPGGLLGLDLQAIGDPVGFLFDLGKSYALHPVASPDGRVYFGGGMRRLIALDPSGEAAWVRRAESGRLAVDREGNPLEAAGKTLTSYDARGEPRWTFEALSALGQPVVGPDGTVYVYSETGLVHAIDSLGRARWSFALDAVPQATPTVGGDGTLYVATWQGTLYALDGDGRKRFTLAVPPGAGRVAVGHDGRLYCVGSDRRLYAYAAP